MTYKQLVSLRQYSYTLKKSFENDKIENIDFNEYGYVNYMLYYIGKVISVYSEITYFIKKYHFKEIIEDDVDFFDEDLNLKNILLTFTDEVNSNLSHLDKNLPTIFIDYVSLYHENRKLMDKKIKETFKDMPKYKIVNKELILIDDNEMNNLELENQKFSFDVSYSAYLWDEYYNKILNLIENEEYEDLLLHLDIDNN